MSPLIVFALGLAGPDTVAVRTIDRVPAADRLGDSAAWGTPQIRIRTGQGSVSAWLLQMADSVYLVAAIPDSTVYWGDDLVVSLDTEGDRADAPQHDDFQWYFRRSLDSTVIYRGRAGQWDAPQGDPDWRLRSERSGAGWDVQAAEWPGGGGWSVVLRLDAGWLELARGSPGLGLRIYDDEPGGWYAWPAPPRDTHAARAERHPKLWGTVTSIGPGASSGAAPRGAPGTRP